MRTAGRYPSGAVLNADFITRRAGVKDGEQVIVTDVEIETLPPFGLLCLHQNTVKNMCAKLGWKLQSPEHQAEIKDLRAEHATALKRLAQFDELNQVLQHTMESMK